MQFSLNCFSPTQLASSSLLRLGQEVDKEAIRNRESIYLLLDLVIFVFGSLFLQIESSFNFDFATDCAGFSLPDDGSARVVLPLRPAAQSLSGRLPVG